MARLDEVSEYKNTLISRILENEDLVKALYYPETNYLEQPPLDDPSILVYENIFPHRFIPKVNVERKTFLTVSLRKVRKSNNNASIKVGHLYIEVFTNTNLFKTDYGKTRVDHIVSLIDELFNSQRGIGIGGLQFFEMDDLLINTEYSGAYLIYRSIDFN